MSLLHKIPLPYSGRVLIGVWLFYHHTTSFQIWPLDGIFTFGIVPCEGAKCLKGFLIEDNVDTKQEKWTILNQTRHYNSVETLDLKQWDFKAIDVITKESPDVNNEKYWKIALSYKRIGGRECWYSNHGGLPNNPRYPDPNHPEEGLQGGMPYYLCKPVYEAYNSWTPLEEILPNETYIKDSRYNVTIDSNFRMVINNMPSFGDVYEVTSTQVIINFDLEQYKKDHPSLYRIYYILYKSKTVNNIRFTPKHTNNKNFTPKKGVKYA